MRWSTDRTDIASVNAMTGQVNALSPGVATMTLESEEDGDACDSQSCYRR